MSEISFTSLIRPVAIKELMNATAGMGKKCYSGYPWSVKESVLSSDVYTTGVCDCTACLISDGQQALLMHICPTETHSGKFNEIVKFIKDKIDVTNENIQAILVGSREDNPMSAKVFQNFRDFLDLFKIPTTILRHDSSNDFLPNISVAYKSSSDEFLIASRTIDKYLYNSKSNREIVNKSFKEVIIAPCDEV